MDLQRRGAVDQARYWTWNEFVALPTETVTVDTHCVTKWSKPVAGRVGKGSPVVLFVADPLPKGPIDPPTWGGVFSPED